MTWAHPLLLVLSPVGLGWWLFRRPGRSQGGSHFANIHRFWAGPRGLSDTPAIRRHARGLLFVLGTIGVLLALARPQWGTVEETSFDQSREVLLALDLSRSMLAEDVAPTRLARAKLLSEALLEQLHGERVGLAVFAGTAFLQSPLSADYEVLRDFLKDLDPSYLPQGGTNYDGLLSTAEKAFGETGDGDRFLVILSDGEAHDTQWKDHLSELQQRGIRVIALGVGTPEGAVLPDGKGGFVKDEQGAVVLSRLEPATLQELASATSGTYRDAATWVDIAALVNATVDQGRKGQYVEQHGARPQDRFQWFLAPALIALLLSFWIDFPVFPTARVVPLRQSARRPLPTTAMAAALLCGLLWAVPRHTTALPIVPENGGQPAPAPAAVANSPQQQLETTVAALSDKPTLSARDYARLATDTVAYAGQPGSAPRDTRSAVIDDALAAVDRGEGLDAHAADWPALRRELERLKELAKQPPPKPQANQQQEDSQNQEKQNQDKSGQESSGQNSADQQQAADKPSGQEGQGGAQNKDGKGAPPQSPPQPGDAQEHAGDSQQAQGGTKEQSASSPGDSPKNDAPKKSDEGTASQQAVAEGADQEQAGTPDSGHDPQPAEEQSNDPNKASAVPERGAPKPLEAADAALGDLEKPNPENAAGEHESEPPPPTRMIGGGRAVAAAQDQGNPVLAAAVGKMERIKEGDAPAILFDRMNQADGAPVPANTGKNW